MGLSFSKLLELDYIEILAASQDKLVLNDDKRKRLYALDKKQRGLFGVNSPRGYRRDIAKDIALKAEMERKRQRVVVDEKKDEKKDAVTEDAAVMVEKNETDQKIRIIPCYRGEF